jgi:hypothetical protein
MRQHQAGVIEKGSTRRRQFDAVRAAREQLSANLVFKVADLPTQRRL